MRPRWTELSPYEQSLVDRMRELVGESGRASLEGAVSNPSVFSYGVAGHPTVHVLFDSLYASRMARLRAFDAIRDSVRRATEPVLATVVFLDSLDDPSATVEIRRRPGRLIQDFLVFARKRYSLEVFGAALSALRSIRQREGDVPAQASTVVLRDSIAPPGWIAGLDPERKRIYLDAKNWPAEDVDGIGRGSTFNIGLRKTRP